MITAYMKIGAVFTVIVAGTTFWYSYNKKITIIEQLNAKVAQQSQQIKMEQDRTIEVIRESNESIEKLNQRIIDAEIAQTRAIERLNRYTEDFQELQREANEYKERYQKDRLARLSEKKGGLLTRLAKKAAEKRNSQWEELTQ